MRRRANGEGSISQEKSGRYRISISITQGGKRIRKTKTAWKKADAVAALDALRNGAPLIEAKPTVIASGFSVGTYLDEWLKTIDNGNRSQNTIDNYSDMVRLHIKPHIGEIPLSSFNADATIKWLNKLKELEVGSRTRELCFVVLKSAMARPTRKKLCDSPFDRDEVERPKHDAPDCVPFTLAESLKLMESTRGKREHVVVALGLTAGMRSGEVFGTCLDRIDLREGILRIDQQVTETSKGISLEKPKTECSIRVINLTPIAVTAIREHLAILKAEGRKDLKILFPPLGAGEFQTRSNFRRRYWQPLLKRLGFKPRGFHHTRHTFATLALGAGVPIAVVSKILGHSKSSITFDTYAHALPEHKKEAVKTIHGLFTVD